MTCDITDVKSPLLAILDWPKWALAIWDWFQMGVSHLSPMQRYTWKNFEVQQSGSNDKNWTKIIMNLR